MNESRVQKRSLVARIGVSGRRSFAGLFTFRFRNVLADLAFVGDLGLETVLLVGRVGDDLSSAIGEEDAVLAGDLSAVVVGLVGEVVLAGFFVYDVAEVERHVGNVFLGFCLIGLSGTSV